MCNPVDNPYLHRIICNKVAAHRHAAMLEGVRMGLEAAAHKATSFLVGDPKAGIPLRNPMAHEISDAIRALSPAAIVEGVK